MVVEDGVVATRERLLDAAEELFARRGYPGTSVRDITARAGSNLAAVNYHFGSKENLYREAVLRRLGSLRQQRLAALAAAGRGRGGAADLAHTLRLLADTFLAPGGESRGAPASMRLVMREVLEPRLPPGVFEEQLADPVRRALTAAIARAAPALDQRRVQLCARSCLAQLVHLLHADRLSRGGDDGAEFAPAELVEHVVRFSVAAIDHLQEVRP